MFKAIILVAMVQSGSGYKTVELDRFATMGECIAAQEMLVLRRGELAVDVQGFICSLFYTSVPLGPLGE